MVIQEKEEQQKEKCCVRGEGREEYKEQRKMTNDRGQGREQCYHLKINLRDLKESSRRKLDLKEYFPGRGMRP